MTKTKSGPGEKEPAFIILRKHLCKCFFILIAVALIVVLKFYTDEKSFDQVRVKLHGVAKNLHLSEHEHSRAHAEMAKVGEEFEAHLDRDMKELAAGQRLLRTLKETQVAYEANVTAIVEAVFAGAVNGQKPEAMQTLEAAKQQLSDRLVAASGVMFSAQTTNVGALVHKLAQGAKDATERREGLQGEVLHNLRESAEHTHDHEAEPPSDDWPAAAEGDANNEDDHWAKETERWHNQTGEQRTPALHFTACPKGKCARAMTNVVAPCNSAHFRLPALQLTCFSTGSRRGCTRTHRPTPASTTAMTSRPSMTTPPTCTRCSKRHMRSSRRTSPSGAKCRWGSLASAPMACFCGRCE